MIGVGITTSYIYHKSGDSKVIFYTTGDTFVFSSWHKSLLTESRLD